MELGMTVTFILWFNLTCQPVLAIPLPPFSLTQIGTTTWGSEPGCKQTSTISSFVSRGELTFPGQVIAGYSFNHA